MDEDCAPKDYCWFSSPDDKKNNQRTCIEMWSRKIGTVFGWSMQGTKPTQFDYEQNGKQCHSGLAIQNTTNPNAGFCVQAKEIWQKN